MREFDYLQAIVLGIVQGLTEFLPISSSGHLALVQHWMNLDPDSPHMLLFDLAVHVGTLVAVAMVFARQFGRFVTRLMAESAAGFHGRRFAWRIVGLGVLACIPTAAIGLAFKDVLTEAFGKPRWIALALFLTGSLLWVTGRIPRPRRGWRRFGWGRALLVGVGQGLAIMPGLSRSGTTIAVAMCAGLRREWSGEFSFFIAFPAICGASLLEFRSLSSGVGASVGDSLTGPLVAGTVVATITGYLALRLLMRAVRRAKLHWFCYYCWLLSIVVLIAAR